MSLPTLDRLSFCDMWLDRIKSFADCEYQRGVWFGDEQPDIIDSYEDSIDEILTTAKGRLNLITDYLNPKCNALIQEFVAKIDHYRHSPSYYSSSSIEKLLTDPNWLSIVKLAQETCQELITFKKELTDAEKRS